MTVVSPLPYQSLEVKETIRHLSYENFQGWKISNSWKKRSVPMNVCENACGGNVVELSEQSPDEGNIPLCPHTD